MTERLGTITSGTPVNPACHLGTPGGITASTIFAVGDSGTVCNSLRRGCNGPSYRVTASATLYGVHGDGSQVLYTVGSGGTSCACGPAV